MMTIVIMIIMNTIIVKSIINLMTTLSSQPLVPVLLRLRSPSMRSTVWPWQKKMWSWTVESLFGVIWSVIDWWPEIDQSKVQRSVKKHIRTIVYLICYKAPDTLATSKVKLGIPGVRWGFWRSPCVHVCCSNTGQLLDSLILTIRSFTTPASIAQMSRNSPISPDHWV